ncbi:uncharacterized protein SCHCODRAFT_02583769 [Schizophyllum commune H4-8]|nr:uncharacterized protein SCHCODRAFT_02583769 [Schizophyllum commune H4-8]KAI5890545.1 hypothetical protein SCHCODRAFT_02583769 [Schizophyllum commune H4-8]
MTSRKRSSSGFVQSQGGRSTRRRADAAPAYHGNETHGGEIALNSVGATAAETAVSPGAGEAISPVQRSSTTSSIPALVATPSHVGPSANGPFVQYVPGSSNRPRNGPPHVCTVCDKHFMRPSTLATHMNIHSGATPYICGFQGCHARFNARSNVTRHRYLHGAAFAQKQGDIETGRAARGMTVFVEPVVASPSGIPMAPPNGPLVSTRVSASSYEMAGEFGAAWSVDDAGSSNEVGPSSAQQPADHEVRWMPVNQVSRGRTSYSPIAMTGSRGSKKQHRNAGPRSEG